MSNQLKNRILELLDESRSFNANDVLVNVAPEHPKLLFNPGDLTFSISAFPTAILRDAEKTLKESGVNPMCMAQGTVELDVNGKKVNTPILLTPLEIKKDKVRKMLTLIPEEEVSFLNPFLERELKRLEVVTLNEGSQQPVLPMNSPKEDVEAFLEDKGFKTASDSPVIIGNFHHHRYEILKELEGLLASEALSENLYDLFGVGDQETSATIPLSKDLLLPADTDHERVFDEVQHTNLVIQGPPGTGKSQVLTNLVAKILKQHRTTVVVSEKHVALEVIQNKLAAFGLDRLCFIASSDQLSHSFLRDLKQTWDYFEALNPTPVNNLRLSEQYEDNLQMTLDLLRQEELIGGVSFHTFRALQSGKTIEAYPYSSDVTSIKHYLEHQATIERIYNEQVERSLGCIKPETLKGDTLFRLDTRIEQWLGDLRILQEDFEILDWESFTQQMKTAALCQVYENDLYKKYASIFKPNSKVQKRFNSLRKKYLKARSEVERIQSNQSQWKIVPSQAETMVLIDALDNGSFFTRLHARRRWKELSALPVEKASGLLKAHLDDLEKINTLSQLIIDFCEIGIESVETEVPLIHQTLALYSEIQWKELAEISPENRQRMTTHHARMEHLYHDLKNAFHFNATEDLVSYLEQLKSDLSKLIVGKKEFEQLEAECLHALRRNTSLQDFEGELLNHHRTLFKERFPNYASFDINDIHSKVNDVIRAQEEEARLFAREIEWDIYQTFTAYHQLLNTPARKLTEAQKAQKARLRKGKSLLVKEFAKTRSHPSLRQFFESDAREWIQLLKPIWLSNPAQLSKCFPLETDVFDVAVFDEASQIPLQNGLGAIHRSKRIVIAGDEHQMGPGSYFSSGPQEIQDLLHQANYNWNKVALKHHYRSVHPDLIAFSNKHFYNGELKAFPACGVSNVLHHHLVTEGVFTDRRNEQEAKAVAELLQKALKSDKTVGIVAFSEEQLACIRSVMDTPSQQLLTDRIETNTAFFKALENVQGDECDQLIISFGYAKNEDGEFHMRFGPMNTINGRRRLNVLLTRAKERIDFFCSVTSSDFKLSDNESVNLLRQWITASEQSTGAHEIHMPFGVDATVGSSTVTLNNIQETLPVAREVVTLQQVLEQRGWTVGYN